jgi:lysophospholipase L1-like esterase
MFGSPSGVNNDARAAAGVVRWEVMASIEMVRPRGGGEGYARLTPESSRAEDASSAAPVARPARSLWTRLGDVADETLPRPPRGGNPADRRRVWRWATVSTLLCALMFALVASNDRARGLREESPDDASPASTASSSAPPSPAPADVIDAGSNVVRASRPAPRGPRGPRGLRASPDACARGQHPVPEYVEVDPPAPREGTPDGWRRFASELARDAATNGADAKLILLGDSIFELFRGTSLGRPRREYSTAPAALAARLGDYHPISLAVAGDTAANLLWRLDNGGFVGGAKLAPDETPSSPSPSSSPYVVVMIGTNDLSEVVRVSGARVGGVGRDSACLAEEHVDALLRVVPRVVAGYRAVVERVRRAAPSSKIVALGLTPRGEWISRGGLRAVSHAQPSVWTAAIEEINRRVRAYAEGPGAEAAKSTGGVVAFQPCEDGFLEKDDVTGERRVARNKMNDGLHPSEGGGFEALVECIAAGMARADRIAEPVERAGIYPYE